jgi:hypothetical protein
MPLFYYILKQGSNAIVDRDGTEFPGEAEARSHANIVARELMRNQKSKMRAWRLQVCDDYLQPVLELPLVQLDDSLAHLPPESRRAIENVWRNADSLSDSISDVRRSLEQVKATIARASELLLNSPLRGG